MEIKISQRTFLSILLGVLIALLSVLVFSGCKGGHSRPNNDFIKSVSVDETNKVTVAVDIPANSVGLLSIDNQPSVNNVILHDGDVVLGVFQAGQYTISVQLLDTNRSDSESITIYPLGIVEPPPPPPPPPTCATLQCNVNSDGAVVCVVDMNDMPFVFLSRVDSGEPPVLIEEDTTFVTCPLDEGTYTFRLLVGDTAFYACTVEVDAKDNDHSDPGDAFDIPPEPECNKTRFNVCHNGQNLLLPWHALKAHSRHLGDKLGKCD